MSLVPEARKVTWPPRGGDPVTLHGVSWATYERLRAEPLDRQVRMSYLDGTLTLVPPSIRHDHLSRSLLALVVAAAEAWGIEFEPVGSATLRRPGPPLDPDRGAGKEPDEGIYLGADAARVRQLDDLDLRVDPPPTLAIEVDHAGQSSPSLPTYARLAVPEVWIVRAADGSVAFHVLEGDGYRPADRSLALPRLTPSLVAHALGRKTEGSRAWLAWLRGWLAGLPGA